jgi:sugar transferase (PEP-CTERM/EpsH1 system associated)
VKILWVKAGGLVPLDLGGRIRSFHILQELARKHEVTLFTFYREHADDAHAQLRDIFSRVVCLPLRLPTPRTFAEGIAYARHLFSFRPYTLAKFCQRRVAQRLQQVLRDQEYDIIVCDFIFAAGIIPWDFPCPKVLFTHNVEASIYLRHYQVARNPVWKAVCWREYRAMANAERHYLMLADHVLTVSEADRDSFGRFIDKDKLTVIPTGVDLSYFRPGPETDGNHQSEHRAVVFTGAMDWMPNEDAVEYFTHQVLPSVVQQVPDTTFWIVGRQPSRRVQALAETDSRIKVTGRVEDIRPYVLDASAFVVPLRIAGGTRLKIFEAMAMGKAVVSTSIGAEGLPVTNGENILLADDPSKFADEIVKLLKSSALRKQIGAAGRQLVEQEYGWASVATRFENVLSTVATRFPRLSPEGQPVKRAETEIGDPRRIADENSHNLS